MHAHPFGSTSADQQVKRDRERCVCVFFLNFVIFFNSENLPTYFKVSCRSLQKILIVRDVFE